MSQELASMRDTETDVAQDLPETVDEAGVRRIDRIATVMDDGLEIPGTNQSIGLDPIVGILPVAGDAVMAALSLVIVVQSALLGVKKRTLLRMLANIALELVVGSLPLVGDLFDAYWKANRRNVNLALRDLGADPV